MVPGELSLDLLVFELLWLIDLGFLFAFKIVRYGLWITNLPAGRGFGTGEHPLDRQNFQYNQGFNHRGRGNGGRRGVHMEREFHEPYPPFHRRENFGRGARWGFRGPPEIPPGHYPERVRHGATGRGFRGPPEIPPGHYPERVTHGATGRGYDYDAYRREPYSFEEGYDRSFMGSRFDDPYPYDDVSYGRKRPHYMMDEDPDFPEPSRHHPRLDYSDHTDSVHGSRYGDDMAPDGFYTQDYRLANRSFDYDGRPFSPFYGHDGAYGRDRAHGRGYYH